MRRLGRAVRSLAAALIMAALVWAAWSIGELDDAPVPTSGRTLRAIDGDSFAVGAGADAVEVRLAGIDAPELRQDCTDAAGRLWPCGREARRALAAALAAGPMMCMAVGTDRYRRTLATCGDGQGGDVAQQLVRGGWALVNDREAAVSTLALAEARARREKLGIWRGTMTPPADWRASRTAKVAG